MKAAKTLFGLLCIFGFLPACSSGETTNTAAHDYLIFGTYAGECVGDCATLFKVENGNLYLDTVEFPFEYTRKVKDITFDPKALPPEYYEIALKALTKFPAELEQMEGQEFGCPDCDDRGAIYLESKIQGNRKVWTIDISTSERFTAPDFMAAYSQDLAAIFAELSALSEKIDP